MPYQQDFGVPVNDKGVALPTHPTNPSSNDADFLKTQFKNAKHASQGRALGTDANHSTAFAQSSAGNDSSNDKNFRESEFEKAKQRFAHQTMPGLTD